MDGTTDSTKIEAGVKDFAMALKALADELKAKDDIFRGGAGGAGPMFVVIGSSVRCLESAVLRLAGAAGDGNFTLVALDQISAASQMINAATDQVKEINLLSASLYPQGWGPIPALFARINAAKDILVKGLDGCSGGPSDVGNDFKRYFSDNKDVIDNVLGEVLVP